MAKKPGLWANIHAKRKRGESPAKKGDKNYPETLDIGEGAERLDEISKKLARSYVDKATADRDKNAKDWMSTGSGEAFNKAEDREKNIQRATSKLYKGTPAGKIMGTKNPAKVSATGKDPAEPKEKSKGITGLVKKLTRKEEFVNEGLKKARKNVGADTCWDGYKAKGTKKKDGKEVPNCVKEGKIADQMRANLKAKKKSWDERGEKAKKDGYDALDKVKKTQADLDKSDFINNIKEGKTFAEFCAEGKSRIETDPDYRKRFKALADNFAEKRKEQTKAKMKKESVEILDVDGNMVAEITDLISPEPMTGWKQQMDEAAWTRKEGKNKAEGLNEKGRKSYERENPGSDLKAPQPEGGPRKKSFCARMGGMKGPLKDEKGEPTRKKLALDKWKC